MPLADWDFNFSPELDTTEYVSPPSSLRLSVPSYGAGGGLCRRPETLNLPRGRIVTYIKGRNPWGNASNSRAQLIFRSQDPIGECNLDSQGRASSGYTIRIDPYSQQVILYKDGIQLALQDILTDVIDNVLFEEWNRYRLTWWSGLAEEGLLVRLEVYYADAWHLVCNEFNDTEDKYKDSTINRIGVSVYYYPCRFDDTEIWGVIVP